MNVITEYQNQIRALESQLGELKYATKELLATIELHTCCMTNDVNISALDDDIDRLEKVLDQSQ
jgi:hypothetical protein